MLRKLFLSRKKKKKKRGNAVQVALIFLAEEQAMLWAETGDGGLVQDLG